MFATKSIRYYTKAIETFAQLDDSNKSLCLYEKKLSAKWFENFYLKNMGQEALKL